MFFYNNNFKELERMQRDIESLFTQVEKRRNSFPPVNIYNNGDDIIAQFTVPGMAKKDISITFENGTLIVKGERDTNISDDKYTLVREERSYGSFSRAIEIPIQINPNSIKASLKNGILSISMTKAEEAKAKQISIN